MPDLGPADLAVVAVSVLIGAVTFSGSFVAWGKLRGRSLGAFPGIRLVSIAIALGVIAAVVPWNSQLFLVAVKIGPALAAGNTVVLKASEYASAAMLEFGRLVEEAGFPPGVVNIVCGFGDPCGSTLVRRCEAMW